LPYNKVSLECRLFINNLIPYNAQLQMDKFV